MSEINFTNVHANIFFPNLVICARCDDLIIYIRAVVHLHFYFLRKENKPPSGVLLSNRCTYIANKRGGRGGGLCLITMQQR